MVHHDEPVERIYSPIPSVSPLIADLNGNGGDWIPFSEEAIAQASNYNALSPICTFFAQGRCNMGDRCPFRHEMVHALELPTIPQVLRPCRYFALGTCRKGDACPLIHDIRARPAVARAPDLTSDNVRREGSCWYYSQGHCRKGDRCQFRHDSDGRPPSPGVGPIMSDTGEQATSWLAGADDWGADSPAASKWAMEDPVSKPQEDSYSGRIDSGTASGWFQETDEAKWTVQDPVSKPLKTGSYGAGVDGGDASGWLQDIDDNGWSLEKQIGEKQSIGQDSENAEAGWLHQTDENPEWNIAQQDADDWLPNVPPKTRGRRENGWGNAASSPSPVEDLGAEQSWDLPWPDAVPEAKPPQKAYCKYFGQGHCYKGETCEFRHIEERHGDMDPVQQDVDEEVCSFFDPHNLKLRASQHPTGPLPVSPETELVRRPRLFARNSKFEYVFSGASSPSHLPLYGAVRLWSYS